MKKYLPVEWTDDAPGQAGTLINKERLDRMQTQYLNAAGIQVLDTLPSVPNGNENICIVNNVLYVYTDKWTSFASLASDGRIVGSGNRSGLSTTGALVTDQPNAQNVSPSYGFISFLNTNQAIFADEPSTVRCGGISIYNETQTAVIQMVISSQSRKIAIRNATSASTWSAWEVHGGAVNWSSIVSKPVAFAPETHASSHRQGGTDAIGLGNGMIAGLSTNDYSVTDKSKVNNVPMHTIIELAGKASTSHAATHRQDGTDAIDLGDGTTAGLSTNDFSNTLKAKLDAADAIDYIPIRTPAELLLVASAQTVNGRTYARNAKYILMNDIDMTGQTWVPLSGATAFTGEFDGNGKTVRNITYSATGSGTTYVGFFGLVSTGSIRNVRLENVNFTFNANNNTTYYGTIVARKTDTGVIENCVAIGNANLSNIGATHNIGGIATGQSMTIRNCKNYVNISTTGGTTNISAGGISSNSGTNVVVEGCVNYGNIAVSVANSIGGIVASSGFVNAGTIRKCKNYGNMIITNTSTQQPRVAGISAFCSADISDCVNYGTVSVDSSATSYIGGIVADKEAGLGPAVIARCANYGKVISLNAGIGHAGGIMGRDQTSGAILGTTVKDCFNMGLVQSNGTASDSAVGGIIGQKSSTNIPTHLINCYNLGIIRRQSGTPSANIGSILGSVGTNVLAVNCYYLTGTRWSGATQLSDALNGGAGGGGGGPQQLTLDGVSTPARTGIQGSGAKTLDQLQPLISGLQDDSSIYYTGSTVANSITFPGYDFNNVWRGTHPIGSPVLKSIGES